MNLTVDAKVYAEYRARCELVRRSIAAGAKDSAILAAGVFVDSVELIAHKDTNRYVAGFQQAVNDVSHLGGPAAASVRRPVLALKPSQYREEYLKRLAEQSDLLLRKHKFLSDRMRRWYDDKGRKKDRWYFKEQNRLDKIGKRIDRADEEFAKAESIPTALFFGRSHWRTDHSGTLGAFKGRLATVRTKVYGGAGRLVAAGARAFVQLHNKEAHCRVVEYNYHTVRDALAMTKGVGVKRLTKRVAQAILARTRGGNSGTRN